MLSSLFNTVWNSYMTIPIYVTSSYYVTIQGLVLIACFCTIVGVFFYELRRG